MVHPCTLQTRGSMLAHIVLSESWIVGDFDDQYQNRQNQRDSSKHFVTPLMAIISILRQTIVFGFLDFTPMLRGPCVDSPAMAMLDWSSMIADIEQIEAYRPALTGHCYRMLGSVVDADDATQETIIRAWKNADQFDGRAALLTWLYRIATNVCLAELSDRKRRARPMEEGPAGAPTHALVEHPRTHWIEPIPDGRAI